MAQAIERLLATPKTIPVFPASIDMMVSRSRIAGYEVDQTSWCGKPIFPSRACFRPNPMEHCLAQFRRVLTPNYGTIDRDNS